jgi:hypothetical protein
MMSRVGQFVFAALLLAGAGLVSRADDTKVVDVETKMRKAFADLAHSQAEVRDAARNELMGFERRYLTTFQRVVEQNRPLLPSQAAVLRQIVTHVYLAGEPYQANDNRGFLGVRMQATTVSQRVAPPVEGNPAELIEPLPQTGVVIVERLPGFVGARTLLDGDVILAIAESPQIQFGSGMAFSNAIAATTPGSTIHFHVLRRGRVVKVPVVLDARPTAAENQDQAAMDALDQQRRQKADTYWRESFGPLVRDGVG